MSIVIQTHGGAVDLGAETDPWVIAFTSNNSKHNPDRCYKCGRIWDSHMLTTTGDNRMKFTCGIKDLSVCSVCSNTKPDGLPLYCVHNIKFSDTCKNCHAYHTFCPFCGSTANCFGDIGCILMLMYGDMHSTPDKTPKRKAEEGIDVVNFNPPSFKFFKGDVMI